jgi:hypothetical protein
VFLADIAVVAPLHHRPVSGQSSREELEMTMQADLATLDELPAVVARLVAIRAAANNLAVIDYAGADVLWQELDLALEGLTDGVPNALLYLAGLKHAGGNLAAFDRWDAGVAGRINLGEFVD